MSKRAGKLSRRYAVALVSAAKKEGVTEATKLQELAKSLIGFAQYFESDKQLQAALLSPAFPRGEREKALAAVCEAAKLSDLATRSVNLIFRRDRLANLAEIATAFSELADKEAGVVQVEVVTAQQLDAAEQTRVTGTLKQLISGNPQFHWQVKPEILGGMIVRFGGRIIDGSVVGKLNRLQHELSR